MMMTSTSTFSSFLLFLCLVLMTTSAANNNNNDDDEDYEYTVCQDSSIVVSHLVLVCDSPGAYYYGSGKYRNANTCRAGDKAKLSMQLQITESEEEETDDDDNDDDTVTYPQAYLTVSIAAYGTVEQVVLYQDQDLCDAVVSKTKNVVCPQPGNYTLYEPFYWGDQDDSDEYDYTFAPKVTVGIASTVGANQYDLGGANTNRCSGGYTFKKWTTGVRTSMANTFKSFVITFGLLGVTMTTLGLAALWLLRQATRTVVKKVPLIIVDEELDSSPRYYMAMRQPVDV